MPNSITMNRYSNTKQKSALGKLMTCIAPQKGKIIVALILGAIGALLRLASPMLIKEVSTAIVQAAESKITWENAMPTIYIYSLAALGSFLIGFIFEYIQIVLVTRATTETNRSLREKMINKINTLPLNYFDTRNIGDILSYVTNDVDVIGQTLNLTLSNIITASITLIGSTIILFTFNWLLGLIVLCALPLALIIMSIVGKRSEIQFTKRGHLTSDISSLAEESYTAFEIVKSFNVVNKFKEEFAETNYKLERVNYRAESYSGLMIPLMQFFGNLIFAAICVVGGYLATTFNSQADPAQVAMIVAAVTYGGQLIAPLSNLAQLIATFQQALAATNRVYSMLEQKDEPDESNKTLKIEKIDGNVSFENVRFGYTKDRVIIHNFSHACKAGQKIAIVGPTGAGKTTMVNLLMRFYELNSGKITIEGHNTFEMNRSYVRGLFGMVLQDTWLFQGTIMENLKFSRRDATDEEVIEACKATHCDEFITQLGGYNRMIKEDCGLSSGQKQLLTIARAMVQNAPMLILDEATSSVDTRTELLIQDAMDKLMKGRTSFVIAHRLSTIKNSDAIIVMKDGDVVEIGNHDQLLAKGGLYADLYNSQFAKKAEPVKPTIKTTKAKVVKATKKRAPRPKATVVKKVTITKIIKK